MNSYSRSAVLCVFQPITVLLNVDQSGGTLLANFTKIFVAAARYYQEESGSEVGCFASWFL